MKRIIAFVVFVILSGCAHRAMADKVESFRYNHKLIQVGDEKLYVLNSCGDPETKAERLGEYRDIDEWTYNMGSRDFVYVVKFKSGRIFEIDQQGRGFQKMGASTLLKGEPKVEVSAVTTEDGHLYTWVKGIIKNKGGATAKDVRVEVRATDRENRLINMESAYAHPDKIGPGKEASFKVGIKKNDKISKYSPVLTWEPDL